jgi:long-chain acyl-CoA synthetase
MNIYPAEIEMVLVQHPLVKDCAVVGVAHPLLGEVVKAYIELEPDVCHEPALTVQILQYLGARLSAMKLPQQIEYIAVVPRDPNGKLYRRLLRREGKNSSDRRD